MAKVELRRTSELVGRGAATDAEFDAARSKQLSTAAAAAGARRDAESARIALEQAAANLHYCTLVSPLDEATVAARYVDAGERVAPNQPAFVLLDVSSVVVEFGVPDTLIGRLELGQTLKVACDALPARQFQGVVHKIASTADRRTRTYAVEVRIDDPSGLRPGMIATVHLAQDVQACLLPLSAIMPGTSQSEFESFRVTEEVRLGFELRQACFDARQLFGRGRTFAAIICRIELGQLGPLGDAIALVKRVFPASRASEAVNVGHRAANAERQLRTGQLLHHAAVLNASDDHLRLDTYDPNPGGACLGAFHCQRISPRCQPRSAGMGDCRDHRQRDAGDSHRPKGPVPSRGSAAPSSG